MRKLIPARRCDELLKPLGARFDLVLASANKDRAGNKSEQVTCRKKGSYKEETKLRRWPVKFGTVVVCSKCKQPIVSGQGYGYICFKIPGNEGYHFFHRREPGGDCWEAYLRERRP